MDKTDITVNFKSVDYTPGEKVVLYDDIKADIISLSITKKEIQYECSWFHNGDRKTAFFHDFELRRFSS